MFFYIIIFSAVIIALLFNNLLTKQSEKQIFEIVMLIWLCLISGTRYNIGGSDYLIYENMYNVIPVIKDFDFNNIHSIYGTFGVEKGYLFLCSVIKTIGFNFYGFTLLHSIFFYSCMYKGIRKYTYNFNFIILVFLYKLFFYNTFISMRQSITLAIFFLALRFIEEKKPIKYFASVFIAFFFHSAAIILFFVYFINMIKLTKKMLILLNIIFIPSILISMLNLPVLKVFNFVLKIFSNPTIINKANDLIQGAFLSSINISHTLEYLLIMLLVIINYKKIIAIDKHSEFIIKLFLLLLPLFTLFRGYEILTRVKDYFTITYGIVLGYLCLIDNRKYNLVVQLGTIILCAYGYYRFIVQFDGGALMPYESYIFIGKSIFN